MKIVQFTAENIKKLRVVEITPTGFNVITGKNGSGKSSVLDAIWYALTGGKSIPGKPVRDGAEKAKVRLDLGEYVVERKFTAAGTTSLTVENAEGLKVTSPQTVLDKIIGSLTFDPLEFSRMKAKDQFDLLKGVAKLEIDIEALAAEDIKDFEARKIVNRDITTLEGQVAGLPPVPVGEVPAALVDTAKLMATLQDIQRHNRAVDDNFAHRAKILAARDEAEAAIKNIQEKIVAMDEMIKKYPEDMEKQDEAVVSKQIAEAGETNAKFQQSQRRVELLKTHKEKKAESEKLTRAMDTRAETRNNALRAAKMPVEGITLGLGTVLYNGVPFDQASSAEQLRVSVAIAMAANPQLKVIRIKDGSLLDEEGLAILREMTGKNDYQVWCERVDTSGTVGIFMEEGEVKAENPA